MNLEQFRAFKEKMIAIVSGADEKYKDFDESDYEKLLQEYNSLQDQLLSSDLSAIPFEEWEGLTLISEGVLDLSKTHANIDFSLLESADFEQLKLQGCNVRGINILRYDENTFDEEFMRENPDFFPDENLPKEIKDKFYHREIEFSDLIEYPSLRKCVTPYSFGGKYDSASRELVSDIGFDYAMRMFDENPEFIRVITSGDRMAYLSSPDKKQSYEEAKQFVYTKVIESAKRWGNDLPALDIIPDEMKQSFPNVFIQDGELPQETIERYYKGNLGLGELRYYRDVLQTKEIDIGTKRNYGYSNIKKVFGDIWTFIDKVPRDVESEVVGYLSRFYNDEEFEQLSQKNPEELIENAIRYSLANSREIMDLDKLITYCEYLPMEEAITNEKVRDFVFNCGFTMLQEYNRKNNYFLDKSSSTFSNIENSLLGQLAQVAEFPEGTIINTEEELTEFLGQTIQTLRKSTEYSIKSLLKSNSKELSTIFPQEFLDYNLLDRLLGNMDEARKSTLIGKLEAGFNGDTTTLLEVIREYPELVDVVKNKNLILNYAYDGLFSEIGKDKFLEIGTNYGTSLTKIVNELPDDKLFALIEQMKTSENYMEALNSAIYENLIGKGKINISILPDSFKSQHPDLYLKDNAPEELKERFYGHDMWGSLKFLTPRDIQEHPEWIPYLMHINLSKSMEQKDINVYNSQDGNASHLAQQMSFYEALGIQFSQEEILNLMVNYGEYLETRNFSFDVGVDKQQNYERFLNTMYKQFEARFVFYRDNLPDEFKEKYPALFLDNNAPEELKNLFYQKKISPEMIQNHPEWIQYLTDKNLKVFCDSRVLRFVNSAWFIEDKKVIYDLFTKYGEYLITCNVDLKNVDEDFLEDGIKSQIIQSITKDRTRYDESARAIIGQECPDLFLDENAPEELKECFYNITSNTPLTFELLKQHKEWMPFLQDKNILLSLKKRNLGVRGLEELFNKYGADEALRIGMKNPESVMKMLGDNKFELLSQWYDKLHFIPHYVVMTDFPIEQSDKFMASGKKWSQLMRIERHNLNEESKSALLKASMCFGVFDNDMDGFNKIMQLFTGLPKDLSESDMEKIMASFTDSAPKWEEIYVKREDGKYHLVLNTQQNKELANTLREKMESLNISEVLTPDKAHKLFGGFAMEYEPDFRDFIMNNMETILSSDEYITYISSMQKQWAEIKALNSNRVLTLDLALAFVKTNNYQDVQIGNDRLAEVSNQAGYSQQDFDTLQQIYNYGKSRTFNSIPRIKNTSGEYTYEVLRLDDPLAVAIGTLTDCCQELGNAAETSMEHSMVDKHGRIFVIKDSAGNIVAQSWMWRNQNVVCFDNIEIPAKAFTRAEKGGTTREQFTDTIYTLYQQAGEELIEKDEKVYAQLLEDGKITEEQFEALKLGKITVGTGYNDIADALRRNSKQDTSRVARPLDFEPPVKLNHSLYTSDSTSQYVIAGSEEVVKSSEATPTVYQDEFIMHDDSNTRQQDVLVLQKLELTTKKDEYYARTASDETEKIVSDIAYNYNLNPETTRIIMNANFAIIYDTKEEEVVVGDILYNTKINNNGTEIDITDKVAMQIRMAIEQIGIKGKKFNISRLNQEQLEMCSKAMNLEHEIDEERGLSHGAR